MSSTHGLVHAELKLSGAGGYFCNSFY